MAIYGTAIAAEALGDHDEARTSLLEAAGIGFPLALRAMVDRTRGGDRFEWQHRAALAGDAASAFWLGTRAHRLHGDLESAQLFYEKAAASAHPDAINALAWIATNFENHFEARMWRRLHGFVRALDAVPS